jgi:hemoglobin-like flavoprotein
MMDTLTDSQAETARRALAVVWPQADTLGLLFYARLFELDPALRALFKVDLNKQAHTLMTMLALCAEGLENRAELSYTLRNLGARHVGYGVKPRDYLTVQEALLWTLRAGAGEAWDAESESAVSAMIGMFVEEMQKGAGNGQ